jgi:nucleotide-binding universal stress UspA family protein
MLEIKLILCPVDFSEFSVRAYDHALSLAEHYRAKLVAMHIVELARYPFADYVASTGDYGTSAVRLARVVKSNFGNL